MALTAVLSSQGGLGIQRVDVCSRGQGTGSTSGSEAFRVIIWFRIIYCSGFQQAARGGGRLYPQGTFTNGGRHF